MDVVASVPAKEAIDLTYRVASGSFALHTALERHAQDVLAELDLTKPLADALWQLEPGGEPLPRRVLAERLNCDPSNVTFIADRLEERGLVKRAVGRSDRRVKALALTASGVKIRKKLISAIIEAPALERLSGTEKRQLADLLERSVAGENRMRHPDAAAELD
jgi:DNA-binding MarR family transcriptional regulator